MKIFANLHGAWLVFKHELQITLGKRSFWLTTIVLPVIIIAFQVLPQVLVQGQLDEDTSLEEAIAGVELAPLAYVDLAGIIDEVPPEIGGDLVIEYATLAEGREARSRDEIGSLYVVEADYVASGRVTRIDAGVAALEQMSHEYLLDFLINMGLTGNPALTTVLQNPSLTARDEASHLSLAPDAVEAERPAGRIGFDLTSYAVMLVLFMTIVGSGSLVLQSVAGEKENRTAEVLLLSLHPRDFMLGKVMAMGVASVVQLTIWLSAAYIVMGNGDALAMLGVEGAIAFAPRLIFWGLVFGLAGYALYASMFGALGALAPTAREGSQFQMIVMLPLMAPLFVNYALMSEPNGTLATVMSLVPFTAPVTMVMRMASVSIPAWQLALSLGLLLLTAYAMVSLAGRFFRADTLLSGLKLDWRRVVDVFRSPKEA